MFQCRGSGGCVSVSCVDCNVSFFGDDYRVHTSCVSEAQRYEKTVYRGGGGGGGKAKLGPQERWNATIARAALPGASPAVPPPPPDAMRCVGALVEMDNVPRKERQFMNFAANSLRGIVPGGRREAVVREVWGYLAATRDAERAAEAGGGAATAAEGQDAGAAAAVGEKRCLAGAEVTEGAEGGAVSSRKKRRDRDDTEGTASPSDDADDKKLRKKVLKRMTKVLKKKDGKSAEAVELRAAVVKKMTGVVNADGEAVGRLVDEILVGGGAGTFETAGPLVSLVR